VITDIDDSPHGESRVGGELVIVGTGYRALGDLSQQARSYLRAADKVFYLIGEPLLTQHIIKCNPSAESLFPFYAKGKPRAASYREMVDRVLCEVRQGSLVCVAFYGHPGVFVNPSHEAIRQAREEGFRARMLPAPSAEDWLFADLGIDPARAGCQSFEATDFLLHARIFDPASVLILWQVGVIGAQDWPAGYDHRPNTRVLTEVLTRTYHADHEVIIYEASSYEVCEPRIERVPLAKLTAVELSAISTLVVPPAVRRPADRQMAQRLGFV
jgi:uncharacterized protein YabN with tetrapyrrole methylase and pyrophosphatase domain